VYRGTVTRNDDPEARGRIQVKVGDVGHTLAPDVWVDPAFDGAGAQRGQFWPPEVGDSVRVSFEAGQTDSPIIYWGGWFGGAEVPNEMAPKKDSPPRQRGFTTRAGHQLIFSDVPGNEFVRLVWHKPATGDASLTDAKETADREVGDFTFMEFTNDGSIRLSTKNGALVSLDTEESNILILSEQGHSVSLTGDGINLVDKNGTNMVTIADGTVNVVAGDAVNISGKSVNLDTGTVFLGSQAKFSAVIGEQLIAWLATHTHLTPGVPSGPAAGGTPTLPPVPPPPPTILSRVVKLR